MRREFKVRDLRNKHFFQVDDAYLNGYAKFCGVAATGVYLSLCRHASKEQVCFPSLELIAEELAISRKTAQRSVKTLEGYNIVRKEKTRASNGKWLHNTYVLLDKSEWNSISTGQKRPMANQRTNSSQPEDIYDLTRGHQSPTKDTHLEGNTLKKETHERGELRSLSPPPNDFFNDLEAQEKMILFLEGRGVERKMAEQELRKFISYWTEPNKGGTKVRWQGEKYFDLRRRLATWFSRINSFNKIKEKKVIKI